MAKAEVARLPLKDEDPPDKSQISAASSSSLTNAQHRTIRPAAVKDLKNLLELEQKSFPSDLLSPRQMRLHITNPKALMLVATPENADNILGYILVFIRKSPLHARYYSLATAAEAQGQGIGSLLLKTAEQQLLARNIFRHSLEVRTSAPKTVNLYQKHGFTIAKTLPHFYEDGEDAYKMEKDLNQ